MHPLSHSSLHTHLKIHNNSQLFLPRKQHPSSRFNSSMTYSMENFLPLLSLSLPELTMHSLYPKYIFVTVYKALCAYKSVSPIRLEAI